MPQNENRDAIILGAGVSGLVAAKLLQRQGMTNIALIDEYSHVGGNHIARHIGPFTFDIGSFLFQNDSPFFGHFPELASLYVPVTISVGRVTPAGNVSSYPISISKEVFAKGPLEISLTILSLLTARLCRSAINAGDYARFWIGNRLYEKSGLSNYIERFYGVKAEDIEIDFAKKRMSWISEKATFRNIFKDFFTSKKNGSWPQQLVRPSTGFLTIYDAARQSLEQEGAMFVLGEPVERIAKTGNGFEILTKRRVFRTERIIGTIPLRSLLSLCGFDDAPRLKSVDLVSLFFSFTGSRGFPHNILYNFTATGRWKRLTMFSDYYGQSNLKEYFCVEINKRKAEKIDQLVADFLETSRKFGLFEGDCRLEGYEITKNAYPVYTAGASETAQSAIAKLRQFGIQAFGRQGGFDYLSTAAATTLVAQDNIAAMTSSG